MDTCRRRAIADAVRLLRHRSKLSVSDLARRADLSEHLVRSVEQARVDLSLAVVERLAAALSVAPEALLAPGKVGDD